MTNVTLRDEKMQMRRQTLFISAIGAVIVYALWNIEALSILTFPLRLFVTYIHEISHSLMAIITGGEVVGFTISPDGSGVATTAGGIRALILPAGYLGAAFFGSFMFYLANTVRKLRFLAILIGVLLIIFTLLYARPNAQGALSALVIGLLFGAALSVSGWKLSTQINQLLLNILSIVLALNAVLDLLALIRSTSAVIVTGSGIIRNDAAAFSAEIAPIVPPVFWAVLWAIVAIGMLGTAVYFSIVHPLRRPEM
jgi:voltage-gated potassium channel Kch